jgi:toxin-antitoxin system PIN domain toxin
VFCRITQMGFLRLLTRIPVVSKTPIAPHEAWEIYKELRRDSRVAFAQEPGAIEAHWIELMRHGTSGANTWTDAYLAAFAMGHRYTLVTLDQAFRRWKSLDLHCLS